MLKYLSTLDICQIRLDFVDFTIGGPVNSLENSVSNTATTNCQNDNLVIAVSLDFNLSGTSKKYVIHL